MMMEDGFCHSSPKVSLQRKSKKCVAHISPKKLTFSGNFTEQHKHFDIKATERASMRRDILNTVIKRTESRLLEGTDEVPSKLVDENPMYEDPRDVIGDKPPKPPRKRTIQAVAVASPRPTRDSKSLLREQKRKLSKKYEGLITTLIGRCEESVVAISEKDSHILKLREKLKTVLEYNKLFADENAQLKSQHSTLVQYVEECKTALKEERDRNIELVAKCKELGDRVRQFDVPDKEHSEAIPLVEVCMSCSSRQILLHQAREQTARLQRDMQALKDVLYRLNVQLSRYQEKLRANIQNIASDKDKDKSERFDPDSLITTSLGYKGPEVNADDGHAKSGTEDQPQTARVVDLSGLLSAQALAPLFDAYQENLQEKDSLILDYEKQFEKINKKSKQIVDENKSLLEKVTAVEQEIVQVRQSYKKLVVEKETADIERATLLERAERAESKLKEVYELYEDKMAAMMRDYETVHREYFGLKTALEASEGKMAQLTVLRARTVPADLHERRLQHCSRLLEELKHQYSMENERKAEQIGKLQQQLRGAEERCGNAAREHEASKEELAVALKNVQ